MLGREYSIDCGLCMAEPINTESYPLLDVHIKTLRRLLGICLPFISNGVIEVVAQDITAEFYPRFIAISGPFYPHFGPHAGFPLLRE